MCLYLSSGLGAGALELEWVSHHLAGVETAPSRLSGRTWAGVLTTWQAIQRGRTGLGSCTDTALRVHLSDSHLTGVNAAGAHERARLPSGRR